MKTVFLRELLLAFRRISTYISIGLSVFTAIFFVSANLTYTNTTISSTVSFAQLVSILAVPVLTVMVFMPSKKSNTDAFYDMLPIKSRDIFLGKLLATATLFVISIAMMLFYPMISGAFGEVDHAQCYSLILVYALSEIAYIAICSAVCVALKKRSRILAFAICYVLGLLLLFAGIANVVISVKPMVSLVLFAVLILIVAVIIFVVTRKIVLSAAVLAALEGLLAILYVTAPQLFVRGFERFLDALSIFDRLGAFTTGLFDVGALVFYACAISAIVFLAYRSFIKKREKRTGNTLLTVASVVIAIAVVIGNVALYFLPYSVTMSDMTLTRRNSVGDAAQRHLAMTDEPVTIYLLEPTGAVDYELYLENIAACSPNITLEKIYYDNTPEFYTERGIGLDYANSLYIESAKRGDYLSYVDLFSYTNETLKNQFSIGTMTVDDYQAYYNMFASNSAYSDLLTVLMYETVENFNADAMICSLVEYVTKDILPTNYYLTGHGEPELNAADGAFVGFGLNECTLENGVPTDAASIMINSPATDISEAEKQALLGFLARGGEITFITNVQNLAMPNLMAILAEYGMSATEDIVTVTKPADDTQTTDQTDSEDQTDSKEKTSEVTPIINTQSDIMYLFSGVEYTFSLNNTNNITVDENAKPSLILTPLLAVVDGETTYTIAYSAETAAGSRIAWFTGAEAFNDSKSLARFCPIVASTWTSIQYESDVTNVPAVVYEYRSTAITDNDAVAVSVALIVIPIAFVIVGCIIVIRRRRMKAA